MSACPACGAEMVAGLALACGYGGFSVRVELPPTCPDSECNRAGQVERDRAATARAIEAGVIDP